jgi:transposase
LELPRHSPDLNPIEKMWSKLKALLRAVRDTHGWFALFGYRFS